MRIPLALAALSLALAGGPVRARAPDFNATLQFAAEEVDGSKEPAVYTFWLDCTRGPGGCVLYVTSYAKCGYPPGAPRMLFYSRSTMHEEGGNAQRPLRIATAADGTLRIEIAGVSPETQPGLSRMTLALGYGTGDATRRLATHLEGQLAWQPHPRVARPLPEPRALRLLPSGIAALNRACPLAIVVP